MALPKDEAEARKHYQAQEKPLGRPFRSPDPGITAVDGPKDILAIIEGETQGQVVPTFRHRTPQNIHDPVAALQKAIRAWQSGMVETTFLDKHVHDTEDLTLFYILYGEMKDRDRVNALDKLSKLAWEKQKELLKQNNIERAREDKQLKNTLENQKRLEKLMASGAFVDGKEISKNGGGQ